MSMIVVDANTVLELRNSVKECSEHGLIVAAKWASDLLLSIPASKRQVVPPPTTETFPAISKERDTTSTIDQAALELQEHDQITVARRLMEARQYASASNTLRGSASVKAVFLSVYSQYIESERKALQIWHRFDNSRHQPPVPVNMSLIELLDKVKQETDPWLLFLKALLLFRLSRSEEAIESAVGSVNGFPWNWSAWLLLSDCIEREDQLTTTVSKLEIADTHPLLHMFKIRTLGELHGPTPDEIRSCDMLLSDYCFPHSIWLMCLRARTLYNLLDISGAEEQFEQILSMDPYRIEDIDVYSNILYRRDNKGSLSKLAERYLALDKNRPEVCCMIGNHYSIRGEHEKAVKYFRRATHLDRTYFHAWTLMGHEFIEMSNYHAAIESYRRAVDINKRDHRAWYGLGQAYIALGMHLYALHYLQRASLLRPGDISIWEGIGTCFDELGRAQDAVLSYHRSLDSVDADDMQLISVHAKLTRTYQALEDHTTAAMHAMKVIEICEMQEGPKGVIRHNVADYYARANIDLAEHAMRQNTELNQAMRFLEKAIGSQADDSIKAQAGELLKVCRSKLARMGR